MIGLLQRVSEARVNIMGQPVAQIAQGLLVLVGVEREDTEAQAARLLERILSYRVFPDGEQRMNLSLTDVGGELLLVPQFTLAANTKKGNRASFTSAASPERGAELYEQLVARAQHKLPATQSGVFGADMQVHLVNDGPVTFWLQVKSGVVSS